jgi:hypothetical protein
MEGLKMKIKLTNKGKKEIRFIGIIIILTLVAMLILSICNVKSKACEAPITVKHNDVTIPFPKEQPQFYKNRILLPLRQTSDIFGLTTTWNAKTKTATLVNADNSKVIKVQMNSNIVFINGNEMTIDVPALNIDGRLFVPVRFMSGILNEYITYNSATRTLNIFEIDED